MKRPNTAAFDALHRDGMRQQASQLQCVRHLDTDNLMRGQMRRAADIATADGFFHVRMRR